MNDVSGEGRVISPEAVISPERRDASRRSSVCLALRALASSEIRRAAASASAAAAASAAVSGSAMPWDSRRRRKSLACLAIWEGRSCRADWFSCLGRALIQ